MGFFDDLKKKANQLFDEAKKIMNKNLMDATMAACAWVALADGNIDASEKRKIIGCIEHNDTLKIFNTSEVIEKFNKYVSKFEFDKIIGEAECQKVISKITDRSEAKTLVLVCCAIASADDNFDENEKIVVRKICQILNLPASEFNI